MLHTTWKQFKSDFYLTTLTEVIFIMVESPMETIFFQDNENNQRFNVYTATNEIFTILIVSLSEFK